MRTEPMCKTQTTTQKHNVVVRTKRASVSNEFTNQVAATQWKLQTIEVTA